MFCIVKGLEEFGTAKLLEAVGKESVVEFFDSPALDGRTTRIVKSSTLVRRTLGPNTRVYFHDPNDSRWLVGRVIEDANEASFVRFSNKSDRLVEHARLFVRWKRPIADPSVFLSHAVTETPQYANARSGFLNSYIRQRAATGGISALISSTIELEAHQISVVRRVLNDTSQRHLLADEVGLGKTIEAGVIIRQAVLDDPKTHRIVVVSPAGLTHQWREELTGRFGLGDFIDDSILICSLEGIHASEALLTGATMLVVDEAHHLTALNDASAVQAYTTVARHAGGIDRLLLLSATPALRNEVGFLRMLHLLDPVVYRLEDEEAFRQRIVHRQALAETVAFLDAQNILSLDPVLDDLAQMLPMDAQLQSLVVALKAELTHFPDSADPQLEASILKLRAHLSETYRLHRRILRNRRKGLRFITPERRGSECLVVPGWRAPHVESLLEDWRLSAASHSSDSDEATNELSEFYFAMVSAFLEDPRKLRPLCDDRLRRIHSAGVATSFAEDTPLIGRIADAVTDEMWLQTRLDVLAEAVRTQVAKLRKVVVFCADEPTADIVFSFLKTSRTATAVRHSMNEDQSNSWRLFQSDDKVNTIVCGPAAEEGLNLQGGERTIVHFNLPLAPSRIEQRIGRVDRYGSGSAILSSVLVDDGSLLQMGWYRLLDKGLCVFNRSIASLQYLLEDELRRLRRELFANGSECFDSLLAEYSGSDGTVTRELRLIDQQDSLDELSQLRDSHSEMLEDVDCDWRPISSAVTHWVIDTLLFERVMERNLSERRSPEPPYRFRYRKPKAGGPATLIPLSGILYDFIGALDLDAPDGSSSQPLSYQYTAHRKTAVSWGARVLRYGDVFVEAVKTFSDTDDRGRCFGIWRQHAEGPDTGVSLYFRLDFLVETLLKDAEHCLSRAGIAQSTAAHAAIRRRGDRLFAPSTTRVWLTEYGEIADRQVIERCLELPYSKERGAASYTDTNLNSARIHRLMEGFPQTFASWADNCAMVRERAHAWVLDDGELRARQAEALNGAARDSTLRHAQLSARIRTLRGVEADKEQSNLKLEIELDDALRVGIVNPSIRLDVIGFVVLSRDPFPVDAGARESVP